MSEETVTNAPSESAAVGNPANEATLAQIFNTVETLVVVYGFDEQMAFDAVNAIHDKTDVIAASNWILDNGGSDRGGPIRPIDNCPHVIDHVNVSLQELSLERPCGFFQEEQNEVGGKSDKSGQEEDVCPSRENWICLECNAIRCSRYVAGHGLKHWENSRKGPDDVGHCIGVSLCDLSVWCYVCESYIKNDPLNPILKKLEELKFGISDIDQAKDENTYPQSF